MLADQPWVRDLATLIFFWAGSIFAVLVVFAVRSERLQDGSWRPRNNVGWWLAAMLGAQAFAFWANGIDFWRASGPVDLTRTGRVAVIALCATCMFLAWAKGEEPDDG